MPVQFLVSVYATPSCTTAPILFGESSQSTSCQNVQVGQTYTMNLYAINYCSNYSIVITDIATLSFPVIIKSNLTHNSSSFYSVSLSWTPTSSAIGTQILCAAAVDRYEEYIKRYSSRLKINSFFSSL